MWADRPEANDASTFLNFKVHNPKMSDYSPRLCVGIDCIALWIVDKYDGMIRRAVPRALQMVRQVSTLASLLLCMVKPAPDSALSIVSL